ncbi:MAG: SUMF1/EgtB/PvdO family nonheme iron enzyme [Polyangiaceae bacterium]
MCRRGGAGWGDPEAPDSLPAQRIWVEALVIKRFPVTNEQYLFFLNDLVAAGREAEALAACPKPTRIKANEEGEQLSYERGPDGQFRLKAFDLDQIWRPRGPAVLMSWHGAMAYARWLSARAGLPHRLLNELEREKAARGADGRRYPWGDHFDPTWACTANSHPGDPSLGYVSRADVDEYPVDESPYGVRGLAGNTYDLCLNVWTQNGPEVPGGRLLIEPPPSGGEDFRSVRGGAFRVPAVECLAAARHAARPGDRWSTTGMRVGRSYP